MPTPLSNIFERVLKVLLHFRAWLFRRRAPRRVHAPVVLGEEVFAVKVVVHLGGGKVGLGRRGLCVWIAEASITSVEAEL